MTHVFTLECMPPACFEMLAPVLCCLALNLCLIHLHAAPQDPPSAYGSYTLHSPPTRPAVDLGSRPPAANPFAGRAPALTREEELARQVSFVIPTRSVGILL